MFDVPLSALSGGVKKLGETPSLIAFNQLLVIEEAFRTDDSLTSSTVETKLAL